MSFENTTNPLTEDSSNQNVGVENQGTTLHAELLGLSLLLAGSLTDLLVLLHEFVLGRPHCAIIAPTSFAAARIASTSALPLRFWAGTKSPAFAVTSDSQRPPAFQVAR
jgi:hypothetical protein